MPLASVSPGLIPSFAHSSSVTRSAPFSAHDSVRQTCSTYLPTGLRVEHRVVRDDVLDVRRRDAEQPGDVAHGVGGDVALLVLHQIERRQHRRAASIGRIPLDDLVEARAVLRRCRRTAALRLVERAATTCGRWRRRPSSDESSPVHVSHHDVDRSDHGDDVGDQAADDHLLERLAREQRRRRATSRATAGWCRPTRRRSPARRAALRPARRLRPPAP